MHKEQAYVTDYSAHFDTFSASVFVDTDASTFERSEKVEGGAFRWNLLSTGRTSLDTLVVFDASRVSFGRPLLSPAPCSIVSFPCYCLLANEVWHEPSDSFVARASN